MHVHCKKKVSDIPVPSWDVTILSLGGNVIKFFPPRESLVSNIPAGDENVANLFLLCMYEEIFLLL